MTYPGLCSNTVYKEKSPEKMGRGPGASGGSRTKDRLVTGVPVSQGPMSSGILRVPQAKQQSRPMSQQPGSEWQSGLAQTRAQSNFITEKKGSQEITNQRMQKSEVGKGQEVRSRGSWMESKQRGLGSRGNFKWSFDCQAAARRALGRCHPWGDGLGEVMTAGW